MPSPKASAVACAIGEDVYILGGRDTTSKKLLWCYHSATKQWDSIVPPKAFKARVNAAITSDGESLYMGLGFTTGKAYNDKRYLRDWWRFQPSTHTWTQLANYQEQTTVKTITTYHNDNIYVVYGNGFSPSDDCFQYDIAQNAWKQITTWEDLPNSTLGMTGAATQNRLYIGLGKADGKWSSIDWQSNSWNRENDFPGGTRTLAAATATDSYIYVAGGRYFAGTETGGKLYSDVWRFNTKEEFWEYVGELPSGKAENLVGFTLNNQACFGLGEDMDQHLISEIYTIDETPILNTK